MRLCVPNVRFQTDPFCSQCQTSAGFNQVCLNLNLFTLGADDDSLTMSVVQTVELIYQAF